MEERIDVQKFGKFKKGGGSIMSLYLIQDRERVPIDHPPSVPGEDYGRACRKRKTMNGFDSGKDVLTGSTKDLLKKAEIVLNTVFHGRRALAGTINCMYEALLDERDLYQLKREEENITG